jgi:virulence-associated protein VapD
MIMTRIQFDLFVSYSQVSVFTAGLDHPFNDWEQEHVDQGFAWREGSVSFATLEEASALHCEAVVADGWRPHPEAERAIRVPFSVAGGDSVEIASISDGVVFKVGALGSCLLVFETWVDSHADLQARFTFVPHQGSVTPVILKADGALRPPAVLRMTARSA